jgi:drug/metabolite transporter (DMT)-like permease
MSTSPSVNAEQANPKSVWVGVVTIICTLLGWTSIPLFLKYLSHHIDYYNANGWRYGFSALIWLPPLLWAASRGSLPKGLWKAAIIPSIFNVVAQHCFAVAPYKIDPGLMTFALRAQVIFVTIGAAIMFVPERRVIRTPGYLIGLAMVLVGTSLTLLLKPGHFGKTAIDGVLLSLLAGACYAAYALSVRKLMVGMNPLLAFAAVSQYTAAALVVIMLFMGKDHGLQALELLQPEAGATGFFALYGARFGLLLLSAIIGIGMGHTFYFLAIQRLGLAVANSVVQLQPITVSIGSFMIFGEELTSRQWVFGCLAVSGAGVILHAQWLADRRRKAELERDVSGALPD